MRIGDETLELSVSQWLTPARQGAGAEVWCSHADGVLAQRVPCGEGAVILCGSYFGESYHAGDVKGTSPQSAHVRDFERFVTSLVTAAGVPMPLRVDTDDVLMRAGHSGGKKVVFLSGKPGQTASVVFEGSTPTSVNDIISGADAKLAISDDKTVAHVPMGDWGVAVLVSD